MAKDHYSFKYLRSSDDSHMREYPQINLMHQSIYYSIARSLRFIMQRDYDQVPKNTLTISSMHDHVTVPRHLSYLDVYNADMDTMADMIQSSPIPYTEPD